MNLEKLLLIICSYERTRTFQNKRQQLMKEKRESEGNFKRKTLSWTKNRVKFERKERSLTKKTLERRKGFTCRTIKLLEQ